MDLPKIGITSTTNSGSTMWMFESSSR